MSSVSGIVSQTSQAVLLLHDMSSYIRTYIHTHVVSQCIPTYTYLPTFPRPFLRHPSGLSSCPSTNQSTEQSLLYLFPTQIRSPMQICRYVYMYVRIYVSIYVTKIDCMGHSPLVYGPSKQPAHHLPCLPSYRHTCFCSSALNSCELVIVPLWTIATRPLASTCGWAFWSVFPPCVAQRVCAIPIR